MNAHQRFVRNLVAGLTPAQVAALVAEPPSSRSSKLSVSELHEMVRTYADPGTVEAWVGMLADAADPKHADPKWEAGWAGPIARLIFGVELEAVAEGQALREAA